MVLLIVPGIVRAQLDKVQIVADESSDYQVLFKLDTLSNHYTEHKSLESAVNAAFQVPGDTINVVRNLLMRIVVTPDPIANVQWSIARQTGAPEYTLGLAFSTKADTAWIKTRCTGPTVSYDGWGVELTGYRVQVYHTFSCPQILRVDIFAQKGSDQYQSTEFIDLQQ